MTTFREQLILTPSPVVADGKTLRLSVHVGVRLQSDNSSRTKLANFPDLVNFSRFLYGPKPWQFQVVFASGEIYQTALFPTKPANLAGAVSLQMADPAVPLFVDPTSGTPIANSTIQSKALWNALFSGSTPVDPVLLVGGKPRWSPVAAAKLRSYPMDDVADYTLQQWIAVASTFPPDQHPEIDDLVKLGSLEQLSGLVGRTSRALRSNAQRDRTQGMSEKEYAAEILLNNQKYYNRNANGDPWGAQNPSTRLVRAFAQYSNAHRNKASEGSGLLPTKTVPDFHQVLAGLGRHPAVLRALGLVFDLVITPSAGKWPNSQYPLGKQMVQVIASPTGASSKLSVHSAALHVNVGAQGSTVFTPYFQSDGELQANRGMLRLADSSRYRIFTHDVDGGAAKVLHSANELVVKQLYRSRDDANFGKLSNLPALPGFKDEVVVSSAGQDLRKETSSALPSLRNGGIVVTENQRTVGLWSRISRQFAKSGTSFEGIVASFPNSVTAKSIASGAVPGTFLELYGEDTVSGYCFDIYDQTRDLWFSLMKRNQIARFARSGAGLSLEVLGEEASIGLSMTRPVGTTDDYGYREVRESLVRWSGWSLAGTRPGASLPQANMRDLIVSLSGLFPKTVSVGKVLPLTTSGPKVLVAVYALVAVQEVDGSKSTRLGAVLADRLPGSATTYWSATEVGGVTSVKFSSLIKSHPDLGGATSIVIRYESADTSDPSASYAYVLEEPVPTPGTLPVLRYGRSYKVRARPQDLCGNGVRFSQGDVCIPRLSSSSAFTYLRLDPVSPPKILLPEGSPGEQMLTQGETLDQMVIRTMVHIPEGTSTTPLASLYPAQHAETRNPYLPSPRVALPPQVGEEEAELMGWADGVSGRPDPALYPLLKSLSPMSMSSTSNAGKLSVFSASAATTFIPDPAATGMAIYGIPGVGDLNPRVLETDVNGVPTVQIAQGGVVLIDYRRGRVAFSQDPSFQRFQPKPIVITLAPPVSGAFNWDVTQPSFEPIAWDSSSSTLTIRLTPGRMAELQISSYVIGANAAGIAYGSMFALPQWVDNSPVSSLAPKWVIGAKAISGAVLQSTMEQGRFWMVTPWRTLRLVHATSSPLVRPSIDAQKPLTFTRLAGSTTAGITGGVKLHQPSTGKVDLTAAWIDFLDLGPGEPISYLQSSGEFKSFTPGSDPSLLPASVTWGAVAMATSHVGEVKVEVPQMEKISTFSILPGDLTQRFTDTKHRKVAFSVAATTKFADNFRTTISLTVPVPSDPTHVFSFTNPQSSVGVNVVASSVSVVRRVNSDTTLPIPEFSVDPVTGAKIRNWKLLAMISDPTSSPTGDPEAVAQGIVFSLPASFVQSPPASLSVEITYLPAPAIVQSDNVAAATAPQILSGAGFAVAHASNTRRPLPPKVAYAVPTFSWAETSHRDLAGFTDTSSRTTNGFRIFLERPWFSSGADELLGVIVDPTGFPPIDLNNLPVADNVPELPTEWSLVTTWGIDPVGETNGQLGSQFPTASAFTNLANIDGLPAKKITQLAEYAPSNSSVTVLGFRPTYDPSRDFWFADVDMVIPEVYQPMVRLALVRWQPYADDALKVDISRVVRADFMQLPASRTLAVYSPLVVFSGSSTYRLTLTGPMASFNSPMSSNPTARTVPTATAFIEKQPTALSGSMAGWTPISDSPVVLSVLSGPNQKDQVTWQGSITAPTMDPNFNYRIVVEQFETYDTGRVNDYVVTKTAERALRLIYHDTYPIS